jgi:hypothetical protein
MILIGAVGVVMFLQAELRELTLIDGPLQPSRNYQFVCLVFI